MSEAKAPSVARARARALGRARRAALESALEQVPGPIDGASRKAVLASIEAWTGSYRIIRETNDGQNVEVEVEVEVDVARLTKRVQLSDPGAGAPAFRLGDVSAAPGCGPADGLAQTVRAELGGGGAVALEGKGPALDVAVECEALGPVEHTRLHAARVRAVARASGQVVARVSGPAFAPAADEARAAGVQQALLDLAEALAVHRKGHVRLRVRAPRPSARVRRLEAVMRNSVLGIDGVTLVGIERDEVELRVRGRLDAGALAGRLRALELPGFSLNVVEVEPPDVVTVVLE